MKPSEALVFLESHTGDEWADHVLWRAPGGMSYILSPPDADARYHTEGFQRFDTVDAMRRQLNDPEVGRVLLLILQQDARREQGKLI
jgi:hypothetical protein